MNTYPSRPNDVRLRLIGLCGKAQVGRLRRSERQEMQYLLNRAAMFFPRCQTAIQKALKISERNL